MYKNSIAILFVFFFLFGCLTTPEEDVEQIELDKTVLEDARSKHPSADIIEIESVDLMNGINITNVRVSYYVNSICPERYRLRYKYPEFGYETGVIIEIVKDCKYTYTPDSIITFEEQAIVAAHTLSGTDEVKEFIGKGENIKVETHYDSTSGIWEVTFKNKESLNEMKVTLQSKNPQILSIEKLGEELEEIEEEELE